jgi:regulatory protein YycI of two-component signal transduction system YycFG
VTVEQLWWTTLGIYLVVLLVVAALLTLILLEAKKIHAGVSEIWNVGQKVANNTIHISMLETTNHIAGQILASAKGIVAATAQIGAHAASCPGCPKCVLGRAR